jgi:asparagine synthase (glutamine-hydrolysing)
MPTDLVFESSNGAKSARLADSIGPTPQLDIETLCARVILHPAREGATIWRDVHVRGVARANAPEVIAGEIPTTVIDAVDYVRRALEESVERAFLGKRTVAVMTSGGVDSSALLALALDWAKRDPSRTAFGVAVEFGGAGDDRPHLAALERHLGHEVVRIRPEDAVSRFAAFLRGVDAAPFTWPGGPFEIECLDRARALGAEVCATGAGADELFDGVPQSLADDATSLFGVVDACLRARRTRAFVPVPRSRPFTWVVRPLLARHVPRRARVWRARRSTWSAPDWAGPTLRRAVDDARERVVVAPRPRDARDRFDAWRSAAAQEPVVWLRHQEQVAARIERRDPYDDAILARAITALRPAWMLHGDIRRGLFREAIRGLVPESLRMREDKAYFEEGFTRFVQAIGGFDRLRPFARATHLGDLGVVDPNRLTAAFEELAANPIDSFGWATVWPALAVEAFLRHRDGTR